MENKGIMEQLREHLAQGRTSGELIGLGFRPGTVYKVQRQFRAKGLRGSLSGTSGGTSPVTGSDPETCLAEDDEDLEWAWLDEEGDSEMVEPLVQARIDDLESQTETLRRRMEALEESSGSLQQATEHVQLQTRRSEGLEMQVEALTRSQAANEKQNAVWQERWDQMTQLVDAVCTRVHLADEALVETNPRLGLERLSKEAMERIRKNSKYTGEKARRDELDRIVSEWAERVL
ncbi:MAG: hypothetical protein O2913_10420 [Chloroflexi bacterium]|nr:hypothetical protein [Chloroflexota bacterium]